MKPLLLFLLCFTIIKQCSAQSLDYISVRKKNGRIIKNFYAGSAILLQTIEGSYLQGLIKTIRADSIFLTIYDIRLMPTTYGGLVRDTLTTSIISVYYKDIKRIYLARRRSFYVRNVPGLLMLGGGGYFALNLLNGAYFSQSVTSEKKLKMLGFSAGLFGLGYLLHRLFYNDGFSKTSQPIVYINLSPKKA